MAKEPELTEKDIGRIDATIFFFRNILQNEKWTRDMKYYLLKKVFSKFGGEIKALKEEFE